MEYSSQLTNSLTLIFFRGVGWLGSTTSVSLLKVPEDVSGWLAFGAPNVLELDNISEQIITNSLFSLTIDDG